jgi:hypothetical protein
MSEFADLEAKLRKSLELYQNAETEAERKKWLDVSRRLKQELENQLEPQWSEGESAGAGFVDGLTLGFGDEIYGGIRSGGGLWGDYAKERDEARAWLAEAKEQNPKSYLAGEVGSAFVPGLGAANLVGKGARLAGKGVDVGSDLVKAAGAGALETGLATVGAAESLDDLSAGGLATNAGIGAGAGAGINALLGVGGRGLGKLVSGFGPAFSGQTARGTQKVTQALQDDGFDTVESVRARAAELGDEALVADLGANTQSTLATYGNRQGPGRQQMIETLQARNDGASGRVQNAIDDTIEMNSKTGKQNLTEIEQAAKEKAQPLYDKAYATPITEVSPELAGLMTNPLVQKAMKEARKSMPGKELNVKFLHETLKSLGDEIGKAQRKGASSRSIALTELKNGLKAEIERITPEFAEAQKIWADKSSFGRAMEAGQQAVGKNTRSANKVDEFRALSEADQDAFRMGVADELSARLERIKDTAQGEAGAVANKVVGSDAERMLVDEVFGNEGKVLIDILNQEGAFKNTYNQATRQSPTAQRMGDEAEGVANGVNFVDKIGFVINQIADIFRPKLRQEGREAAINGLMKKLSDMSDDELRDLVTGGKLKSMVEQVLGLKVAKLAKQPRGLVSGRLADQVLQLSPDGMLSEPVAR